jgi:hypothetical protein
METEGLPITAPVELPPQVDYRAEPSFGQAATELHGDNPRDEPADAGSHVAPQPNIGNRGYSLNSLDAPPNHMVPREDAAELPAGHTSLDPNGIMGWEMYGAGGDDDPPPP